MKNIISALVMVLLGTNLFAQQNTSTKEGDKPTKQERKKEQDAQRALQFNTTKALVNSRQFVLKADFLIDRNGQRISAPSELNYIMVDSARAMVQTGKNSGHGANGVGGYSASGKITDWKVESNEKQRSINIQINVNTDNGFLTVFINISPGGRTKATVNGNQSFELYAYEGKLVPLENSGVYEGRSLFRN